MGPFLTRGVRARRVQRSAALSFGYVKASCYSRSFKGSTTALLIAVAPRSVTRRRFRNIDKWKIMGGSLSLCSSRKTGKGCLPSSSSSHLSVGAMPLW